MQCMVQVQVLNFTENEGRKDLIEVAVMVETASQRGIVIGAGGRALKRLGTASRKDIEAFLGMPSVAWHCQDASDGSEHTCLRQYKHCVINMAVGPSAGLNWCSLRRCWQAHS